MQEKTKAQQEIDWNKVNITDSRLTFVMKTTLRNKFKQLYSLYKCSCGKFTLLAAGQGRPGRTKSCGCLKRDRATKHILSLKGAGNRAAAKALIKHGMTGTKFYLVYKAMINRCYRPGVRSYENYGGRGIAVAERWHTFENFRDDMHESYLEHIRIFGTANRATQLDRIDNNADYSKENCQWATAREQALNRRPRRGKNQR